MKQAIKSTLAVVAGLASIASTAIVTTPSLVNAYAPERDRYTKSEITQSTWAPDKIVFNSITDSVIGSEFNYVGARECEVQANGRCNTLPTGEYWEGNEVIDVKDGQTYIVRLYVHNNNPYGVTDNYVPFDKANPNRTPTAEEKANSDKGTAENVKVSFNVPSTSSDKVTINGFINTTSGAIPEYLDSVTFSNEGKEKFHLNYVYGSALLENNGIGYGGLSLPDEVINAKSGGVLIGYDKLDGRVPGCYYFDSVITIQVQAVFDYDFTIEKEVRLVDSEDRSWKKAVEAKVGDKVEFLIGYYNDSHLLQNEVAVRDLLPKNLKLVEGTTVLRNSNHVNGVTMISNKIADGGIRIGSYGAGANAYVTFVAEVVDNSLACGPNSLVNYAQGGVGSTIKEDHATVHVTKECEVPEEPETPTKLPQTGPEAIAGGVIAAGSIATAAGYYVASRRQLRK